MNSGIKELIENTLNVFNVSATLFSRDGGEDTLAVRRCLAAYLMHLAAYDSGINLAVISEINGYLGFDFSAGEIFEIMDANGIGKEDFFDIVPGALMLAVAEDNALLEAQPGSAGDLSGALISLYGYLGIEFLSVGGKTTAEARSAMNRYLEMLRNYVKAAKVTLQ